MFSPLIPAPEIRNVVSTVNFFRDETPKQKLDLSKFARHLVNVEYNPDRFIALIIRIRTPTKATALLFPTGRLVCIGAHSEILSRDAALHFATMITRVSRTILHAELSELMMSVNEIITNTFKIRNVVGSTTIPFKIDLNGKWIKLIHLK
jgi:TATA-box binding protein (TBP) (component of TFIID and TFIIIB)